MLGYQVIRIDIEHSFHWSTRRWRLAVLRRIQSRHPRLHEFAEKVLSTHTYTSKKNKGWLENSRAFCLVWRVGYLECMGSQRRNSKNVLTNDFKGSDYVNAGINVLRDQCFSKYLKSLTWSPMRRHSNLKECSREERRNRNLSMYNAGPSRVEDPLGDVTATSHYLAREHVIHCGVSRIYVLSMFNRISNDCMF